MKTKILVSLILLFSILIGFYATAYEKEVDTPEIDKQENIQNKKEKQENLETIDKSSTTAVDVLENQDAETLSVADPVVRPRIISTTTEDPVLSLEDQLRKELLIKLIALYKERIAYETSIELQEADFVSAKISYDSEDNLSVVIKDSDGVRNDFTLDSSEESSIINRLMREYELKRSEVIKKSTFSYAKISENKIDINKDFTIKTLISGDKTLITLTNEDDEYTNWFPMSNVKDATEEFARLHNVRFKTLWENY